MEATSCSPPYTWAITEGALSGGLRLDTGGGVISGTPTEEGDFTITVTVADSFDPANYDSTDLALGVHPAATSTAITIERASNEIGIADTFTVDVFVDPGTDIAGHSST